MESSYVQNLSNNSVLLINWSTEYFDIYWCEMKKNCDRALEEYKSWARSRLSAKYISAMFFVLIAGSTFGRISPSSQVAIWFPVSHRIEHPFERWHFSFPKNSLSAYLIYFLGKIFFWRMDLVEQHSSYQWNSLQNSLQTKLQSFILSTQNQTLIIPQLQKTMFHSTLIKISLIFTALFAFNLACQNNKCNLCVFTCGGDSSCNALCYFASNCCSGCVDCAGDQKVDAPKTLPKNVFILSETERPLLIPASKVEVGNVVIGLTNHGSILLKTDEAAPQNSTMQPLCCCSPTANGCGSSQWCCGGCCCC